MPTDVYLEIGKKRVFASALDWPGWSRSGRDEDSALASLADYAERYAPVVARAELSFPKTAAKRIEVVERVDGSGATDFGVVEKPASRDTEPLSAAKAGRLARLMVAAWEEFDDVVAGAPPTLRKGPRGGGRDRDPIVDHVLGAEVSYARKLGLRLQQPEYSDLTAVTEAREAIAGVIRDRVEVERGWPLPYAARRIVWHVLDHAWEIEDKSESD